MKLCCALLTFGDLVSLPPERKEEREREEGYKKREGGKKRCDMRVVRCLELIGTEIK